MPRILMPFLWAVPVAAQLVTTDAGVLSPELPTIRQRFEWSTREYADELRATTKLSWSPERRLQLDLSVPVVARRVSVPATSVPLRGRQEGLADLELGAKWALVRDDGVMRSDRWSVLADLRLPTGEQDTVVDGQDLGPAAGLGLGTFGGAIGTGYTIVRDRHRAAVALRGWLFDRDDGFAPGEAVTLDVAWWVRLTPREFVPGDTRMEVRGVLELLSRWQADDELRGVDRQNGGVETSFLFGLQANLDPATALEIGLVVPVSSTTESPFGDADYSILFSFKKFF